MRYLLAVRIVEQQFLQDDDTRFQILASNTPGLVFQLEIDQDGKIVFNYLSDGCKALLGIEPQRLQDTPTLFFSMMNEVDRNRFWENMHASAIDFKILNWEGRIWIDEWQDTKWINLRSKPKRLDNGVIQWKGIMTNITQSKNERDELEQSRKRLAELSAHLTKIKEEERSRIAREIHDDLGGNLTAIKIGLSSILKQMPKDQAALIQRAKNLEKIVDDTFEAAHRISGDLRPNILELGIIAALSWQVKEFRKQMGIPCYFTTNITESNETKEQSITLFRICQEAMSNIAKYARAKRVDVGLFFEADGIKMLIHDDGVGIKQSDMMKPNSFGLRGMAERVASLGGKFDIDSLAHKGTGIYVILPYPEQKR